MFKRSLDSITATWLAGLVVFLPLALTLVVLGWLISLFNQYIGPGSELGYLFAALGYTIAANSPMPYLLGTLVLMVAIYLLGRGACGSACAARWHSSSTSRCGASRCIEQPLRLHQSVLSACSTRSRGGIVAR